MPLLVTQHAIITSTDPRVEVGLSTGKEHPDGDQTVDKRGRRLAQKVVTMLMLKLKAKSPNNWRQTGKIPLEMLKVVVSTGAV